MTSTLIQVSRAHRSNQHSHIPSNPPIWKAENPQRVLPQTVSFPSPSFFLKEIYSSASAETDLNSDSANFASAVLWPKTAGMAQPSGSDIHHRHQKPLARCMNYLFEGRWRFFREQGHRPDYLDIASHNLCSTGSLHSRMDTNIESGLLDI